MTNEEYKMIMKIIDKDVLDNNVGDLVKLKTLLCEQISKFENDEKSVPLTINVDEKLGILTQSLLEFVKDNSTSEERQKSRFVRFVSFISIIRKIDYYDVCVFDVLGLDDNYFRKSWQIGPKTIGFYEKLLNKHGLSIKQQLSNEERKYLRFLVSGQKIL